MNIPFPFIFLLTVKVIRFYRCDLNRVKHTEGGHKSDCKNVSGYKVKRDYKKGRYKIMMKVENMTSSRSGREVANQFIIRDDTRIVFQSYDSTIAIIDNSRGSCKAYTG